RNVAIYFSEEAKGKLNQKFCYSLKEHGVMFIGGTESLLKARDMGLTRLFSCFYRKSTGGSDRASKLAAQPAAAR
ncbi:MAG: CheR family methyltransferase, partial [Dehalococcoidia bacterium]